MTIDWFTPIYLLAVYGLVRFFSRPPKSEEGSGQPKHVNWRPLEAVGVSLFIYFAAQLIGGLTLVLLPLVAGYDAEQVANWLENNAVGQFALIGFISLLTLWLLKSFLSKRQATFKTIGFSGRPHWGTLGRVLLGFVFYFIGIVILTSIVKGVFPNLDLDQEQLIGFKNPAAWQLPLVFISLVTLPPLVEELLVRGFLYSGLRPRWPRLAVYLVVSGLFGVAHLQVGSGEPLLWIGALDTFTLSLVLIYLREKTGNLWASIGLHMLKNGIAFASLFVFSQF